ncbi:MAG: hypothetical protein WAV84_00555, partial [Bacteroidota bacterium]
MLLLLAGVGIGLTTSSAHAQLNGTYTIGSGGNYASFTAAVSALSSSGVSGPVTFTVIAGTYTEQIAIYSIAGASAVNTITFDGIDASTRILQYSVSSAYGSVVTFNGGDYIKFKNLTVTSTNASYGYCFLFTNQASYNEISDCVISVPANTTSSYHIPICASSTSSYSSTGNWGDFNLIQDNIINSGYYCIRWNGYSGSVSYAKGNKFIGNTVQDFYYYGMYLYYCNSLEVKNNTVRQRTTGTFTTSGGYSMYIYYPGDGPQIIGNYSYGRYQPFYCYRVNYYTSSISARALIANNMIVGDGTSSMYGLYVYYPRYADVVYNSVNLNNTTSTCYGIYQYGESGSYDVKFANNFINYNGNGTFYGIYNYYSSAFTQFDYNAFWRTGAGGEYWYWNGTSYGSFASMKASVSGYHQNSLWGSPYWVSKTDLHSRSHVGYQAGIPVSVVTDDFDGDARGLNPCIGADEYPAPPPENDLAIDDVMFDNAEGAWAHREDPAEHAVKVVLENTGLGNDLASVTVTYKVGGMPADVNDGVQETFSPGWVNHKATVEFTQRITGLAAGTTANVYAKVFWALDEDNTNDGGMDNAFVETVKVHGIENFEKMDAMLYPFTRDPGYLDLPWTRIDNNGGFSLDIWNGLFNGSNQALAMSAHTEAADEWIVTPGADLDAGSSYRLDFEFRNWGGSPVTVEAAFGETPDPSQMTVFATFANIAPGGFLTAKQLAGGLDPYFNTPLFNGTFYLAFHFTTSGTDSYFSFDKVKLDDNPSPPPKIAFGLPGAPLSTFIDNPAYKITVMANYKQPAIINRTYEVQSKTNIYGAMGDFLWDVETSTPWITLTKETPDPTLQNYNLNPPRPRQMQNFTLTVNPSGLAPGTHVGEITFYGILFNNDFPPPANGLQATNEPLNIQVDLIITNSGSKTGAPYIQQTISTPLTVPGSPYNFIDPTTGDPIATVEVTSGQIDMMTIRAYPNALPQNLSRKLFVKRYWQITHTGTGWTANVTFP